MNRRCATLVLIALTVAVATGTALSSCALDPSSRSSPAPGAATVTDPTDQASFARLLDALRDRRVVYLGEIHDHYDHHVNQLAVIRGLHARGRDLAIGLEAFQTPFQAHLDAYVAGRVDETEMLQRTRYYERWRFDYRLYRDILRFARDEGIPLVALNAPAELVEAVSSQGIAGLTPGLRAQLPAAIPPADAAYRERIRQAFALHGGLDADRFERFLEVQSVWDEYMAQTAADYLARHPRKTLAVLVGSAHVLHDSAVPNRLQRRLPAADAVIVTEPFSALPGVAPDHVLASRNLKLAARGRTGLALAEQGGVVVVRGIAPGSAAAQAGIKPGDRIRRIGDVAVGGLADVRLALTDSAPGERLRLQIERAGNGRSQTLSRVLTPL